MSLAKPSLWRASTLVPLLIFAVFILVPVWGQLTDHTFYVAYFARILIYAIAVVALNLALGFGGLVSLGHALFMGLGAYSVALPAFYGIDNGWVHLGFCLASCALAGLITGAISLRTSGIGFIMITLAFAQMLYFVLVGLVTYGGDDGMSVTSRNLVPGLNMDDPSIFYYVCLALMMLWVLLCRRIVNSPFGMVLRGFQQNERRNVNLGYAPMRYKLTAFVISAAGAGLAGALWANYALYVSPDMASWLKSGTLMAMIVLGGMGTIYGSILGAAVYLGLEQALTAWTENWMLFLGPVLILVVLFSKRGLFGWLAGRNSHD